MSTVRLGSRDAHAAGRCVANIVLPCPAWTLFIPYPEDTISMWNDKLHAQVERELDRLRQRYDLHPDRHNSHTFRHILPWSAASAARPLDLVTVPGDPYSFTADGPTTVTHLLIRDYGSVILEKTHRVDVFDTFTIDPFMRVTTSLAKIMRAMVLSDRRCTVCGYPIEPTTDGLVW